MIKPLPKNMMKALPKRVTGCDRVSTKSENLGKGKK